MSNQTREEELAPGGANWATWSSVSRSLLLGLRSHGGDHDPKKGFSAGLCHCVPHPRPLRTAGAPGMCSRLSFVAVGDALIHQGVCNAAKNQDSTFDFRPMLRLVKDRIARYDLAFYNQETILGGVALGLSTYPCFNSPQEVGDAFLDAGFNLVSLANNHTLDRRENGVLRSLEYWSNRRNVLTAGSYPTQEDRDEMRTVEVNGITCALLAYTTLTNGLRPPAGKEYYVNVYNPETVRVDVRRPRP